MEKRDYILAIGGISFIILVAFMGVIFSGRLKVSNCPCQGVVSHNFVWVLILLAIIFVGCLFYFLFSIKIEKKNKTIKKNLDTIYSILDKEEKEVLGEVVRKDGEINQTEISEKHGKIKAHRIIKKLQEKKIIDIKKTGRTNKIKIKEDLKKELLK